MDRSARRWASNSRWLDALVPKYLSAGRNEKSGKPAGGREVKVAAHAQAAGGNDSGAISEDPDNNSALGEDAAGHPAVQDADLEARIDETGNATTTIAETVAPASAMRPSGRGGDALPSAAMPQHFAFFQREKNGASFGGQSSGHATYSAANSLPDDPLAAYLQQSPAQVASGSGATPDLSAASSRTASSGNVVILETAPSAQAAAHLGGVHSLAVGMPFGVCGCGYLTSPTRMLDWAQKGGILREDGQLPGTRLTEGPDHVATSKPTMGPSNSDPLLDRDLAPAPDWRGTATGTQSKTWTGSLPGGGETGTGATNTKGIGYLGGSVTTRTAGRPAAPSAVTAINPIVLENQLQGNPESEWGIDGAGSTNIEGFATDISVDNGKTIDFKINTNSTNYRIDIYRLGYYGGMGARKVDTLQHTGLQSQPTPLRNGATGTVDAGNWAVSASWAVPDDAVSGVYVAKLVRQDGTFGENHIPFIVRDDDSRSDIVFQTADQTWQAYNGWGGANFYGGNGPATGQGAGRAYAVSYNRPIATRGGVGTFAGPQDYLFGAEYAGIYWLEQNGYDVSYMSGVDADRYGSLLLNHKMYLDVGHDEYWSGQQRANVEAARDAGVHLQFWSGNEVYWRTRWGNSYSSDATPYRTLISYKETWAPGSSIDPSNEWTGTFRDPRQSPPAIGGGSPENSLTGQLFKVDDVGTKLQSITIPYEDADLRFWRNTSVANLQPGQTATLTKNYLGYEWDEAVDNGFDPAGLVKLSSTTLPVETYLLDYGNTTGDAVSTHNLTLYRAPSGALVFGAGTVYWSWGLSDNHDKEVTPTDPRVQQAMVNLLADMGIQPGTLQSGLIAGIESSDETAPTSVVNALATVAVGSAVTLTGTATDTGGGVIAGVEVSTDNGASWHPATGDENWTYSWTPAAAGTYTIRSRAVDDSINLETPSAGRTVTVAGPSYTSLFPASATPAVANTADTSAVELGIRFQTSAAGTVSGIRFYKGNQNTGTHTGSLWDSTGARIATLTFTGETASGWQTGTFSSPVTLTPGQVYTASYHTSAGYYSSTANYFTSNLTSGPLTVPGANNGVFVYGNGGTAPTETYEATNYWVDVMFNPSTGTPGNTAPTAVADAGEATEKGGIANATGGSNATGNVLTNDTDPDAGDTKTVTAVRFGTITGSLGNALAGTYGSLILNAAGVYTYTINESNAAVQALRLSTNTLSDVFSYTMRDTAGATAVANLTVTIRGANDAPVLAAQTANQNATIGTAYSFVLPANTFTDVDSGDTLTYTATSADGSALPTWLSFNAATRTFSGTPTTAGTYGIRVAVADIGGLSASETFNIVTSTTPQPASYSLFSTSATPAVTNNSDTNAVELGVRFQTSVAGTVSGIRFYKGSQDTGTHTGSLWNSSGTRIATLTFTGETASGWQTANFSSPVTLTPGQIYTASYYTSAGRYSTTSNYFTSNVTSGPLTAPGTNNGVFVYGGGNVAPTETYQATNYWVDVIFNPTAGTLGNTTPTAVADAGVATEKGGVANATGGSNATGNVLTNDTDPDAGDTKTVTGVRFGTTTGTLGNALTGTYGSLILNAAGVYTYTINESNAAVQALRLSTNTLSDVFSYTMRDTAGATAAANLTITIRGANDAPVLAAQTANQNATIGTAHSFVLPANTFTDVDSGDTLTYAATSADGSALPGWLSFNTSTRTFSGTPTAAGTYGIRVAATDIGGLSASETFNIVTSTTPQPASYSLFSASATPAQTGLRDGSQIGLGVKFRSSAAGQITGIKFYRSPGDTGQNVVDLWSATGTRLATANFTNTSATGWQTVNLATPYTIAANTTYVASYHTTGTYVASDGFFSSAVTSGPLTAQSNAAAGGNGVYAYGGSATQGVFPNSTYDSANYWADVVFRPQLAA